LGPACIVTTHVMLIF